MEKLKSKNLKLHRTDQCGTIVFTSTGNGLKTKCKEANYESGKKKNSEEIKKQESSITSKEDNNTTNTNNSSKETQNSLIKIIKMKVLKNQLLKQYIFLLQVVNIIL